MRDENLERIRKSLLNMREDLLLEIRHKRQDAAVLRDEGVPDPGDASLRDHIQDFLHLLSDAKRDQIMKIDEALERLDKGTYGFCEQCGEPISIERLEVQPYSRYCIECKTEREEEESRRLGPRNRTL